MRDGQDDDLLMPEHVGDVVLAKTRRQVHPADDACSDVKEPWVLADLLSVIAEEAVEGFGKLTINLQVILKSLVELSPGFGMNVLKPNRSGL